MKLTKCDKCGRLSEGSNDKGWYGLNMPLWIDLCPKCKDELVVFLGASVTISNTSPAATEKREV